MLGVELCDQLRTGRIPFCASDRETSILDRDALREYVSDHTDIDVIVNCSAYTAVDRAEDDVDAAYALNAEGPRNIAKIAVESNAKLIHISTDYVFPGDVDQPLNEDDTPGPVSVYGCSKLEGERSILQEVDDAIVIRTAWLYGKHGNNFVYTMLGLMSTETHISVVNDQFGSPTNARDLAAAIVQICLSDRFVPGLYHYAGLGRASWHDFAKTIHSFGRKTGILSNECRLKSVGSERFPTRAKRPRFSILNSEKISLEYKIKIIDWKDSLGDTLSEIGKKIHQVRERRKRSDQAFDSAKVLAESKSSAYVPTLCSDSIWHLLNGLSALSANPENADSVGQLAESSAVFFDAKMIETMQKMEQFRRGFLSLDNDLSDGPERENLIGTTNSIRELILSRTILTL